MTPKIYIALRNFSKGCCDYMIKDRFLCMALQKTCATKEPVRTLPHTTVSCNFFLGNYKYPSDNVLYVKQIGEHPVALQIKTLNGKTVLSP